MPYMIAFGWLLVKILSYGGLAISIIGVMVFGWYFVTINGRAARGEKSQVPSESWRGPGAILGYKILAIGAASQLLSILISVLLPSRG